MIMMTHLLSLSGNLLIKILVAKQQPTNSNNYYNKKPLYSLIIIVYHNNNYRHTTVIITFRSMLCYSMAIPYSGYFSWGKIFVVFVVERPTTKYLPTKFRSHYGYDTPRPLIQNVRTRGHVGLRSRDRRAVPVQ